MLTQFFLLFLLCLNHTTGNINRPCITPNGAEAICTPLEECKKLKANADSKSKVNFQFTYDSYCSWQYGPIVCCGNDDTYGPGNISNLPGNCGNTTKVDYTWIVRFASKECFGAFVTEKYILTKASCCQNENNEITLPISYKFKKEETKLFPLYKKPRRWNHDLCLINVDISSDTLPVCLVKEEVEIGLEVSLPYLSTSPIDGETISQEECLETFKYASDRELCVKLTRPCTEEVIGNPIVYNEDKWILVGFGKFCNDSVVLVERISRYWEWIVNNI